MKSGIIRSATASPAAAAAQAINALGVDLLPKVAASHDNALFSPYSIQSALAMTYAGADGRTRAEMEHTLHFPADEASLHLSFIALRKALQENSRQTTGDAASSRHAGGATEPVTLTVANRLFGQEGFEFLAPFLAILREKYEAPLSTLDFAGDPVAATKQINEWVEDRTQWRISDLIPPGGLNKLTRLVLVNAVYLKARWETPFRLVWTESRQFHSSRWLGNKVPTMRQFVCCGLEQGDGFRALTVPYSGGGLHLLVLLPDEIRGLEALERQLTVARLQQCAQLPQEMVHLFLPKFEMVAPGVSLRGALCDLGMKTAFDLPVGSANFERLAPRLGANYLSISEVVHQSFMKLDENGTEAVAATAVVPHIGSAPSRKEPVEIHVDRPFLFAIQHRASGACLFLGRVTDPR